MEAISSLYPIFKHLHMLLIAISVLFFIVRFGLHMSHSPLMAKRTLKIAPRVIDTLLLLSGMALCLLIQQYPIEDPWLTEKVLALVAYILLGIMAFRTDRNRLFQTFAFLGALGWVVFAAKLAIFKQAVLIG